MSIPFYTIVFIAIGLSMDAFAVSVGRGFYIKQAHLKQAVILGLAFGFFQALMPQIGWFLGRGLAKIIYNYDHWVAFVLLTAIGGKMIYEGFQEERENDLNGRGSPLTFKLLLTLAIATSIDALAVGVTFSFLQVTILLPVIIIGVITFCFSFIGVFVGKLFGKYIGPKVECLGGIILIGVGLKILLSHLCGTNQICF